MDFDGGFKIEHVKDGLNRDIPYIINKTMMRVDVPEPIRSGQSYKFKIKWWYNINDHIKDGGRSGYEYFEEDDNYIYTVQANTWFAMRSAGSYSLIGCTVAPAFDFNDFELAPATWRPEKFKIEL